MAGNTVEIRSNDFVNTSPDPMKYHFTRDHPEARLGVRGVILPSADSQSGLSPAFDPTIAAPMFVFDGEGMNNVPLDYSKVSPAELWKASAATSDLTSVFRNITIKKESADTGPEAEPQVWKAAIGPSVAPRPSSLAQFGPAASSQSPSAQLAAGPVLSRTEPEPIMMPPALTIPPQAAPQRLGSRDSYEPAAPSMEEVVARAVAAAMAAQAAAREGNSPPKMQPQYPYEEKYQALPQVSRPWEQQAPLPQKAQETSLHFLGIDFLAPEPQRPKHEVTFDLGGAGKMRVRYHQILETNGKIVFVYDTRYMDGSCWTPPEREEETVHVKCAALEKGEATCPLIPIDFKFGVFEFLILLKTQE